MTRDEAEALLDKAINDPALCEKLLYLLRCDKLAVVMYRRRVAAKLLAEGMRKRDVIEALMERLGVSRPTAYRLMEDE